MRYLALGAGEPEVAVLVRLAGRLLAPDLGHDAPVREDEHGEREAVLEHEQDAGVLRLLRPVRPHLGADVAAVLAVPVALLRQHELRQHEDGHRRAHARQPHGHDDPLRPKKSLISSPSAHLAPGAVLATSKDIVEMENHGNALILPRGI